MHIHPCLVNIHAGQNHTKKAGNELFESVAKFRYFGTTLTMKTVFMKKLKAD